MSLAAELGHLARAGVSPHDDVRLALVDALLAANATGTLTQETWEALFAEAMRSLRMRVIADAETALRAAAAHSRYPSGRLRAVLPDAEAADTLLQRLLAQAMPLEQVADRAGDSQARRARAAGVDRGWEGALAVVASETARWHAMAARIAEWQRDTRPLWAATAVIIVVALILASWFGGVLPSPRWFRPINAAWWKLWP